MGLFNFHHLFIIAAVVLLLLPPAEPEISSERHALISLRSAVRGRLQFWNISSATPCSWTGVICSRDNSSVVDLRLPGMALSGPLPPNTISKLTNLVTLSLRYNYLSGPLPTDMFSSLTSLRYLYIHHNSFTGEIPNSIFTVASLVKIDFSENKFSGHIPPSFNNLTHLVTLYLQKNNFFGSIPDLNLHNLVLFDVSNNNLSGRIPHSLAGKPKASFAGNSLCGAPLDSCGDEKPKTKLSGSAIAGIIIGSVIGFLLILLLIFCLCRTMARKGAAKGKEKQVENPGLAGEKGLVFFGKGGWNFDLEDLLRASAEVLGRGTFGNAYKAVLNTGLTMAVKRLRDVDMAEKEFMRKMEEIGRMDHENLVPLRAYFYNRDEKLLVYDYLPMGSLSALLHGNKGGGRTILSWDTRAAIALGAARGIAYLHLQGSSISHGNIKSSNILLTNSYRARVSDFGLARISVPATPPNRVTGYRAPEATDHHKVSQKADVYSFGVLLLELLSGKPPCHSLMNEEGVDLPRWVQTVVRDEWMAEVFDMELLRYQDMEEDMVQLLQLAVDCTALYPDMRPSMADATAKIEVLCRRYLQDSNGDDIVGL